MLGGWGGGGGCMVDPSGPSGPWSIKVTVDNSTAINSVHNKFADLLESRDIDFVINKQPSITVTALAIVPKVKVVKHLNDT